MGLKNFVRVDPVEAILEEISTNVCSCPMLVKEATALIRTVHFDASALLAIFLTLLEKNA